MRFFLNRSLNRSHAVSSVTRAKLYPQVFQRIWIAEGWIFLWEPLGSGSAHLAPVTMDCKSRFGEFLAVRADAHWLSPTGGSDTVPDYVVQTGKLIPQVETLYAITGTGDFSTMVRFDSLADGPGKIGLSELVTSLLDLSSAPAIAFAALVETTCVIGTSLLKSPALGPLPNTVPAMRDWLVIAYDRARKQEMRRVVDGHCRAARFRRVSSPFFVPSTRTRQSEPTSTPPSSTTSLCSAVSCRFRESSPRSSHPPIPILFCT